MNDLEALATEIDSYLTTITVQDSDEKRIVWNDAAPRELRYWFTGLQTTQVAFAELDEYYETLQTLCNLIIDVNGEDVEEEIYNHYWADEYNSGCLKWLSASLYRIEDVNEELANYSSPDLIGAIQDAQNRTRREKAEEILQGMKLRVEVGRVSTSRLWDEE